MCEEIVKKIKTAPQSSGIYLFYQNKTPLYIGKASNLKNRLKSYLKITDLKNSILDREATNLKLIKLSSPIEALIEESKLIKSLKPKYNVLWRDDKNYFYVVFTNETFPKIFLTHQPQRGIRNYESGIKNTVGPFTDGVSLKIVLRLLRRYFPYCTCFGRRSPSAVRSFTRRGLGEGGYHLRPCLNAQIGNCPGYCCRAISTLSDRTMLILEQKKSYQKSLYQISSDRLKRVANINKYKKNIRAIKNILMGRNKKFIKKLRAPSEMLAVENIYEHSTYLEGGSFRFGLRSLYHQKFSSNGHSTKSLNNALYANETVKLYFIKKIECYDISHFSGKEAVGAFTVLVKNENEWQADPASFRRFNIKNTYTKDDPRMIAEILSRRLNHPEWPYPDLIVIDGGITQFRAAKRIVNAGLRKTNGLAKIAKFPIVISFAKPKQEIHGLQLLPQKIQSEIVQLLKEKVVERIIKQTHRFVIGFHRWKRDRIKV